MKQTMKTFDELPSILTARDIVATGICGLNNAYQLLNRRGFPTIEFGGKKFVLKSAFIQWLEKETAEQSGFVVRPEIPAAAEDQNDGKL